MNQPGIGLNFESHTKTSHLTISNIKIRDRAFALLIINFAITILSEPLGKLRQGQPSRWIHVNVISVHDILVINSIVPHLNLVISLNSWSCAKQRTRFVPQRRLSKSRKSLRNRFENSSWNLFGFSAQSSSCRWWDSDMIWHLKPFSSRHCFWHIWQYHRNFCKPFQCYKQLNETTWL